MKKEKKYNFNTIKLPQETLKELQKQVAENGGVYILGLCTIKTTKKYIPKNVDGVFKKGTRILTEQIKILLQPNFSRNVKRYKNVIM